MFQKVETCYKDTNNLIILEDNKLTTENKWNDSIDIEGAPIRVTPVLNGHAPQLPFCKFFWGECTEDPNFNSIHDASRKKDWQKGTVISYIIDFLDNNKNSEFRIFIQSSSSKNKNGWIPSSDRGKPIDLAILGAASYPFAKGYPEGIIKNLEPKKIIVCHWEDFFKPYSSTDKKRLKTTSPKKFVRKSFNALNSDYKDDIISISDPGVDITVRY